MSAKIRPKFVQQLSQEQGAREYARSSFRHGGEVWFSSASWAGWYGAVGGLSIVAVSDFRDASVNVRTRVWEATTGRGLNPRVLMSACAVETAPAHVSASTK